MRGQLVQRAPESSTDSHFREENESLGLKKKSAALEGKKAENKAVKKAGQEQKLAIVPELLLGCSCYPHSM